MTIRASGLSVSPGEVEIQCSLGVDFSKVVESSTISIDGVAANLPLLSGTKAQAGISSLTLAEPYPATLPPVTNGTGTVVIGADSLEASIGKLQSRADYINAFLQVWDDFTDTDNEALPFPLLNGGQALRKSLLSQERKTGEIQADAEAQVANLKAMKYVDFEALREMNRRRYSGSGFVEFGKDYNGAVVDSQSGLLTRAKGSEVVQWANRVDIGRGDSLGIGPSRSGSAIVNVDGVSFDLFAIVDDGITNKNAQIKLPAAPKARVEPTTTTTGAGYTKYEFGVTGNQAYICIADAPSGTLLTDPAYFEARDAVSREDLVGFETFLVKLGAGASEIDAVYPRGLVQSGLTSYEGQTLSNTVMPQGYSAFGEWDTSTQGYGKKWSTMSVAERDVWLNAPENNIYVKDGAYYQWQGRLRSIRGLGNSWTNLPAYSGNVNDRLKYGSNDRSVHAQGADTVPVEILGNSQNAALYQASNGNITGSDVGIYKTYDGSNKAVNGECYFLPLCTVTRRNQGAYHPYLNPMGTAYWAYNQDTTSRTFWHLDTGTTTQSNLADCFTYAVSTPSGNGAIGTTSSGGNYPRPDGRFYDAIYSGDVTDLRLSARPVSESLNARAQSYVNNSVRGVEGLPITHLPVTATATSTSSSSGAFQVGDTSSFVVGGCITIVDSSGNVVIDRAKITNIVTNSAVNWDNTVQSYTRTNGQDYTAIQETESDIKLATHSVTDIIGDPANIKIIMDNYGVTSLLGCRWIPTIPDGASKTFKYNRKSLAAPSYNYTDNNGTSWVSGILGGHNGTTNSYTAGEPTNRVFLLNYETPAYAFKPSQLYAPYNAERSNVHHLGTRTESQYGQIIYSNLMGRVSSWQYTTPPQNPINELAIYDSGITNTIRHGIISTPVAPINDPLCKAVFSIVNIDGLAYPYVEWQENHGNGTTWGSPDTLTPTANITTYTDDLGNTALRGAAIGKYPIGFIGSAA